MLPFSLDWLIFLSIVFVWLVFFFLFKNQKNQVRRRKSREIAEKAVAAGDAYRGAERVEVDAANVDGLSQEELQRLTDEFLSLGFVRVLDYRLRPAGRTDLIGFGRSLVNQRLCCFGEIMALQMSLETRGGLNFSFDSYLEDGWRAGAINRKPHFVDYLERLPKNLRIMLPDATPAKLLQRHLDQRTNLASDLNLKVLTDFSLEIRFRKVAESMAACRQALLNRDILAELTDARNVESEGKWEWSGDYPQDAARQARGKNLRPLMELSPTYSVPQSDALDKMGRPEDSRSTEKPDG